MKLDYKSFFKITLRAMRFNRSDPAIKRDTKWLIQFLLFHGFYTVVFALFVYNVVFVNLKENDFTQACKNGILAVVYLVISFQYSIMIWKQAHLKVLMDTIEEDYVLAQSLPANEQNIIREYALKGQHVCNQWLVIAMIGSGSFIIKQLALTTYYLIVDGKFYLIPLHELVYPPYLEERKDTIPVFVLMYIAIVIYALYSSVMYCAFVPIGPITMLHACGQLEIVRRRIDCLFNSDDLAEVGKNLKDIVKRLQSIYAFIDQIKISFRVAYELTMKTTTIMLPVTSYEVIESLKHGELSVEFIIFIIGGVLFSSSPCFYSDLLMEKGEDVRLAMYSCGWERVYDRGLRSTIRIILQRALRPTGIRTLFRTVCLVALTDVFQQAFTIFNLMNAIWD